MATFTQLILQQRYQIHTLRQQLFSLREIAAVAGTHYSTVSRELRRRLGGSSYTPDRAHEAARLLQRNGPSLRQDYWSYEAARVGLSDPGVQSRLPERSANATD
ncbi:MAG: hypothetical protein CME36_07850 [unclassified Hahellaceae]|nr:hypothetical protein [Hahellaceae bacterium]